MLTAKENYLAVLNHGTPDYVPDSTQVAVAGGALETFENGPLGGGYDDFGLKWLCTQSANGQAVPDPGCHPIPDITEWKKYLKLPDLSKYNWEEMAAMQVGNVNRDEKLIEYQCWNAQFLRMSHLLGFEDGLCSMYEEPEACYDLMDAITDYKCELVGYIAKYFKPDIITSFDDVCTERGPFMSPAKYRELIKPLHKKFIDCVKSYDIMHIQHCCGKCDELVPDFMDEGSIAWSAAQPINDIAGVLEKYGDKFVVIGGYDTNGKPGRPDVTDEEMDAEVKRMMDAYAPKGSFISMGFILSNSTDPMAFVKDMLRIAGHGDKYRYDYYKK